MRRLLVNLIGTALMAPGGGFGQPVTLVESGTSVTFPESLDGKRVAVWGGNSLVVAEGPLGEESAFQAYDVRGKLILDAPLSIPGADHTYVRGFARGAGGTLAVCGLTFPWEGGGGPFLAIIYSDGLSQQVVRTAPYTPNVVAVAPDGTLWTVGRELDARLSEKTGVNLEAGVLRHFDQSGKGLGAFVPRSSVEDPTFLQPDHSELAAASDRVGWLRFSQDGKGVYIEVSARGEISSYPIPERPQPDMYVEINGLAMTGAGEVFVSAMFGDTTGREVRKSFAVFRLDRASRKWSPVAVSGVHLSAELARLYGTSGSDLAVWARGDSPATVLFLSVRR